MPSVMPFACRILVKINAPNTEALVDPDTGQMKQLMCVLMADAWEDDPIARSACKLR
jgi:hypothetical protein